MQRVQAKSARAQSPGVTRARGGETVGAGAASAWGLLASTALTLTACGPSFQVVYEGDARFEHCYAMDESPTVSMQEKSDCWTQWLNGHVYGQTRNRIDYAAMRAKALREAPATPTDEAVMSAAPGGGTGRPIGQDEPVTTNAFATPPKTMSEGDGAHDAGALDKSVGEAASVANRAAAAWTAQAAPSEDCTDRCRATWHACRTACDAKACGSCDATYTRCMKRCF
jgi:hypothetical protein